MHATDSNDTNCPNSESYYTLQAQCVKFEVKGQESDARDPAGCGATLTFTSFRRVPRVPSQSCKDWTGSTGRSWSGKLLGSIASGADCTSGIFSQTPWQDVSAWQQQASTQASAAAVHVGASGSGCWGLWLHSSKNQSLGSARFFGAQVLSTTSMCSMDPSDRCDGRAHGSRPNWTRRRSQPFSQSLDHDQIDLGSHSRVCSPALSRLVCQCVMLALVQHWGWLHGFRLLGFPPRCLSRFWWA